MLQKQPVNVNFAQGLDTKSDPWQIEIGKFLELENSIFNINGRLQKRDGFSVVGTINDSTVNQITNYNDDIIALGNSIYAFNQANGSFVNKGSFYSTNITTESVLANSNNVSFADSAKSSNGLICSTYFQSTRTANEYGFVIQNATTGQTVVNPTLINPNGGTVTGPGKVYFLNNRFVVIFTTNNGVNDILKFITIDSLTLNVTLATNIASNYLAAGLPSSHMTWDAISTTNKIFVGYNAAASDGFYVAVITQLFSVVGPTKVNTLQADVVGSCADGNNVYFAHYQNSTGNGQIVGVTESSGTISVLSGFPQQWILTRFVGNTTAASPNITNIASTANIYVGIQEITPSLAQQPATSDIYQKLQVTQVLTASSVQTNQIFPTSVGTVFEFYRVKNIALEIIGTNITILSEIENVYPYLNPLVTTATTAPTNLIYKRSCTTAGVVGAAPTSALKRGVGIWSRAFKFNNQIYFVGCYSFGATAAQFLTYQAGYYVFDVDGNIVAKLAYQYGSGYATIGLVNTILDSFTGTTTNGSDVVTGIASTLNLKTGQRVISGSTPTTDTFIKTIDSSSQITLTRNATASGLTSFFSNIISFNYLKLGSQQPQSSGVGFQTGAGVVPIINIVSTNTSRVCNLEFLCQTNNASEIGTTLNVSGGYLWNYDGTQATENNFFVFPDTVAVIPNVTTAGNLSVEDYQYVATYEWTDNKGNINRSATSLPTDYTIKTNTNFSGNTTINLPTITGIASTAGLQAGQRFSGGSFGAGVYIISVDSATQITVSQLAGATAAGVAFTMSATQRVSRVNVCVPTLRLTNKLNVSIRVYRYSSSQQTFYLLGSVRQPFLSDPSVDYIIFEDNNSSASIVGNSILYSNGDAEIQNSSPPSGKSPTIFDGRLWVIDSENPNLLWYSKQVIQSAPVEMSGLFTIYISPTQSSQGSTGPVECLYPMDDKLIIFKKNSIYYINGVGPNNAGQGSQYSEPILITSTVGCSNQKSIVFMQNGLMFQSNKGIWLLGRDLSTAYIGADVERTTDDFTVTSANLVPKTNEVRMALNNGTTLMYDYFYKQWSLFTGMSNISSIITNELQTYLNNSGQIRRQTKGVYKDGTDPILMKFRTGWLSLAGIQGFQRAYFLFLLGKYISTHTLTVSLAYDFDSFDTQTINITPTNFSPGNTDLSDVEKWRIILKNQKCESIQVALQENQSSLTAGEGLELSGMNLVVGLKKAYRTQNQFNTTG